MSFIEKGYQIVTDVITKEKAQTLAMDFEAVRTSEYIKHNVPLDFIGHANDIQVSESFSYYGAPCFEKLLQDILPIMESVTGKQLYPTYSYARIYYPHAFMGKHRDRPSCQYSTTITIEVDETPWDIWMEDLKGNVAPFSLAVGSMLVYRGDKLDHWRDVYQGKKQIQAFLHYVDANGEHSSNKYDGRESLNILGN